MFKGNYRIIKKTGFTIVEIMVVMTVLFVIIAAVFLFLIQSFQSYYTGCALNELSNNGSFALDELTRELREGRMATVIIEEKLDPASGQWHDILIFASTRGRYVPANDESYFHIDGNGNPDWQSAVVYYPFTTPTGTGQLRRYVYYNSDLENDDFPLTATVTADRIDLFKNDGSFLAYFNRADGAERILANHISTEDENANHILDPYENDGAVNLPMDNADGVADTGIDYTVNGNTISIKLFLQKPITTIAGLVKRRVSLTLNTAITLRN